MTRSRWGWWIYWTVCLSPTGLLAWAAWLRFQDPYCFPHLDHWLMLFGTIPWFILLASAFNSRSNPDYFVQLKGHGLAALLFTFGWWMGGITSHRVVVSELTKVTRDMEYLHETIARFNFERGHPPMELTDLVPGYLSELPRNASQAFGPCSYSWSWNEIEGARWILMFHETGRFLDDFRLYRYNDLSTDVGDGGIQIRVGNWLAQMGS